MIVQKYDEEIQGTLIVHENTEYSKYVGRHNL